VYSMVQRKEKEKDLRYIQEASAPAAVTVYQTYNIMYTCNRHFVVTFCQKGEVLYNIFQTMGVLYNLASQSGSVYNSHQFSTHNGYASPKYPSPKTLHAYLPTAGTKKLK